MAVWGHPGLGNRPVGLHTLAALVLAFALWVFLTGSAHADDMPDEPSAVVEGSYRNLAVHELGGFRLSRTGNLVTATLGASKSAVQYAARQSPEILFQAPPGFRPQHTVHLHAEGWPVSAEGVLDLEATRPVRFRLRVAPDGSVHHVDGPELDEAGYVGYMISASWPSRDQVGHFHNREVHHNTWHWFSRSGDAVQAVFGSGSSPVQHAARQEVEALFKVPAGYRPTETVVLEVEGYRVDRDGHPLPTLQGPVRFRIQVGAEGTVLYVDGPELDEVGFLAYQVTAQWTAAPAAEFVPLPTVSDADHMCSLNPVVQAAVLATLATGDAPARDCTSVTRDTLATIGELALEFGLHDAPLQRADLAGLIGLRNLSIQMPDVLLQFLSVDLLASQPTLETLDLNFYPKVSHYGLRTYHSLNIEEWQRVPTLSLRLPAVTFRSPMGYPHEFKPYFIEGGVSPRRITGLLDAVSGLVKLSVRARISSCDTPLVVANSNLRELTLTGLLCTYFPHDYLYKLPMLERLTVQSHWLAGVPATFLDRNPRLRFLSLEFQDHNKYRPSDRLGELPRRLLANNPHLEHLSLQGGTLAHESLPNDLFRYSPELREIHVQPSIPGEWLPLNVAAQLTKASPWLTVTPALTGGKELVFSNLTELNLELALSQGEQSQLEGRGCFAPGTALRFPNLKDLSLAYSLPKESSPCVIPDVVYPKLQKLKLTLGDAADPELLVRALRQAPQLTTLTFDSREPLPLSLFAGNPSLETLTVGLRERAVLPDDFLAYTPDLKELSLDAILLRLDGGLKLPPQWLRNVPKLQILSLRGPGKTNYPEDLVDYSPALRYLKLEFMDENIPNNVGGKTLILEHLELHSYHVTRLPDEFLRNTPALEYVFLALGKLASLPQGLLSHAPELEHVDIRGTCSELPEEFLARSHNLNYVSIGDVGRVFNGGYTVAEWLERNRDR